METMLGRSFNEAELHNDGTTRIWDLYSIMRPDIHKIYDDIIHYDARFIIKEPNGSERRLVNVAYTADAKPINPPALSARDRLIEDYVTGRGPRPENFSPDELNVEVNDGEVVIVNGYVVSGSRVNGIRVNSKISDTLRATRIGDIIFSISGTLKPKDIRELYSWIWNRGPMDAKSKANDNEEKTSSDLNKRYNFCLDLWSMGSFNGCKGSSIIRILDLDIKGHSDNGPAFRNWSHIYKDFNTQNVILQLA